MPEWQNYRTVRRIAEVCEWLQMAEVNPGVKTTVVTRPRIYATTPWERRVGLTLGLISIRLTSFLFNASRVVALVVSLQILAWVAVSEIGSASALWCL